MNVEDAEPVAASDSSDQLDPTIESEGFSPSGTLIFVLLMLLGYAIYWGYMWFVVVIERA